MKTEVISVPNIGDGNPASASSLVYLATMAGADVAPITLRTTSLPGKVFHGRMTSNPDHTARYTDSSEQDRVDWKAQIYGGLSYVELLLRLRGKIDRNGYRWNLTQEHALFGPAMFYKAGLIPRMPGCERRVFVPDVQPKESAIVAAAKTDATLVVWNIVAAGVLNSRGVRHSIVKPWHLAGYETPQKGVQVVCKSSGSGIPATWLRSLCEGLSSSGKDYTMVVPAGIARQYDLPVHRSTAQRLNQFYRSIGERTKLLIGYPSELVGVTASLHSKSADPRSASLYPQLLALPPRGEHERNNLAFGLDHGIISAVLNPDGHRLPDFVTPDQKLALGELRDYLVQYVPPKREKVSGVLGRIPIRWD